MIEIRSTYHPHLRVVLAPGSDVAEALERARRDRANTIRTLSRRRRTTEQIANDRAAVDRWHRDHPERVARFKRRWRKRYGTAYMRKHDATASRRAYKAKWARHKRARDRAASAASISRPQRSVKRHVLGLQRIAA